jgi:hypothetical protein
VVGDQNARYVPNQSGSWHRKRLRPWRKPGPGPVGPAASSPAGARVLHTSQAGEPQCARVLGVARGRPVAVGGCWEEALLGWSGDRPLEWRKHVGPAPAPAPAAPAPTCPGCCFGACLPALPPQLTAKMPARYPRTQRDPAPSPAAAPHLIRAMCYSTGARGGETPTTTSTICAFVC